MRKEREEDHSQLLLLQKFISDQLIGDMMSEGQVRDTNLPPVLRSREYMHFDSLCGCIDDTTDEDGASTWALSNVDTVSNGSSTMASTNVDETPNGYYSESVEDRDETDSKVGNEEETFDSGKIHSGSESQNISKKHRMIAKLRKAFERSKNASVDL